MLFRHFQAVNIKHVTFDSLATHFRDWLGVDLAAVEVRVEERQAEIWLRAFLLGSGARNDENLVSALSAGRPDLAAIDRIAGIGPLGPGFEAGRVEA